MKCTSSRKVNRNRRNRNRRRRQRRQKRIAAMLICLVILLGGGTAGVLFVSSVLAGDPVTAYERTAYNTSLYQGDFLSNDLCVTTEDVALDGFTDDTTVHGAGLFDLTDNAVLYGYHLFERLYPASTTKVMTAYLAFKYGNMNDVVTVSEHATDFAWDESVCNLRPGDQLSLYALVCGLLLHSGNDCGTAIAEHISGSEEAFVELMNTEAQQLGATGTHFVNPHGLHNENHYTTAYDLYLIFHAAIQDERFMEVISMESYTADITGSDGTVRQDNWPASNFYSSGQVQAPDGVHVFGGKTGTTSLAGNCVILYVEDADNNPYISVIMGAESRNILYEDMNRLFSAGINAAPAS